MDNNNNDIYKNYKINNLMEDYSVMFEYIQKSQFHIENCYSNSIINFVAKNNYLKQLNECVKHLNLTYNSLILTIDNTSENDIIENDFKIFLNNKNFQSTHTFLQIYNTIKKKHDKINFPYYDLIQTLTQKIGQTIGFSSIHIALSMLINSNYKYFFDEHTNKMLLFYNSVFTPLSFIKTKSQSNTESITVEQIELDTFVLLHNCAKINIRYDDIIISLSGYFVFDSLNIVMRTSELCNKYLFDKKTEINEIIKNKDSINSDFAKSYIRHAPLCDIIVMTPQKFVDKILVDYNLYNKLFFFNLNEIMKEFIKEGTTPKKCLLNMFNIIKLLLLGNNNDGVNIAEVLFSITEEKKNVVGLLSMSEIIYKNLNHFLQIKLKKTTRNINIDINKLKNLDDDLIEKQIVISPNMPDYVKKLAMEKSEEMKHSGSDHSKQLLYVKTLLNYPWISNTIEPIFPNVNEKNCKLFLNNIMEGLEKKVCGHIECKNKIKEIVGKWIINPTGSGSVIGLSGPPGVGKTLIAKAIGDVLGLPFVQINLGGQNDGELLYGHGYSYSSAQPGLIVKKMIDAGKARCIMYFDELDKTNSRNGSNEISNILIHLTDPMTNSEFQDRFFQGINFPLNKVLFIFSYNDPANIDKILLDRIEQINISAFKLLDKKQIVHKFVIEEMCNMICLDHKSVTINDDVIEFIIETYTNEAGIRQLKRKFEKIFLKLNIDKIYKTNIFSENSNNIIITKDYVKLCLGNKVIDVQHINNNDMVGVINGLFATTNGYGGILPIQVYENFTNENNGFIIKMTGSQKKVMRESVTCALSVALNYVRPDIRNSYMNNNKFGFHLHAPDGATPKDGPSAGAAFSVAFVSRLLGKKIKRDVAVTGEIDLIGNVTKIGGLEYKLFGAKKAGIKLVLVSKENEDDIKKIMTDYIDLLIDFDIKLVENLFDVLKYMIVDFDYNDVICENNKN